MRWWFGYLQVLHSFRSWYFNYTASCSHKYHVFLASQINLWSHYFLIMVHIIRYQDPFHIKPFINYSLLKYSSSRSIKLMWDWSQITLSGHHLGLRLLQQDRICVDPFINWNCNYAMGCPEYNCFSETLPSLLWSVLRRQKVSMHSLQYTHWRDKTQLPNLLKILSRWLWRQFN